MSLFPIDIPSLTVSTVFTKGQTQIIVTVSVPASVAVTLTQLTRSRESIAPSLDYRLVATVKKDSTAQGIQFLTVSKTEPWTDLTAAGVLTITKVGIIVSAGPGDVGNEGRSIPVPLTIVDPAAATTTKPAVSPTPNPTPATNSTTQTAPAAQLVAPKPQPMPDTATLGLAQGTRLKEIPVALPSNRFVRITAPISPTATVEGVADNADFLLTMRAGVLNAQTAYWDLVWTSPIAPITKVGFCVTTTGLPGGKSIQPYAFSVGKAVV